MSPLKKNLDKFDICQKIGILTHMLDAPSFVNFHLHVKYN
jgi:hypothetical protein